MIGAGKAKPTPEELTALIEKSSLPTVLVEGPDDIIFYRSVEEELADLGIDVLPAGNKDAVLSIRGCLDQTKLLSAVVFVVDKDLWVYPEFPREIECEDVITTTGYSIENDLFEDANLLELMYESEREKFADELRRFVFWYALAIDRNRRLRISGYRTHAGKILDDIAHYEAEIELQEGEIYPEDLRSRIMESYGSLLRGKSLFSLLSRVFSADGRPVKFGNRQLMELGSRRKGPRVFALTQSIRSKIEAACRVQEAAEQAV